MSFGSLSMPPVPAPAPGERLPRPELTYQLCGSRLGGLFDPALAPPDVLATILAHLPTRDKLRASLVSKAWRAAYRYSDIVWKRCNLSQGALNILFIGVSRPPPFSRTLRGFCARYGSVIEELDVSESGFTAAIDMPRIERSMRRLRLLDIRWCAALLEIDGNPNDAASNVFVEALLSMHQRAGPYERFTLVCCGCGLLLCSGCGYFCDANKRVARQTFLLIQSWMEKGGTDESFAPRPWLRCDSQLCHSSRSQWHAADDCGVIFHPNMRYDGSFVCTGCDKAFCEECLQHFCSHGECEIIQYCADCFEENEGECTTCNDEIMHSHVCDVCCGEVLTCSVPWCKTTMCDSCEPDFRDRSYPNECRCSRCATFVCHAHVQGPYRGPPGNVPLDFRGMFTCEDCGAVLCWECDAGECLGYHEAGWLMWPNSNDLPYPKELLCSTCWNTQEWEEQRLQWDIEAGYASPPREAGGATGSAAEDSKEQEYSAEVWTGGGSSGGDDDDCEMSG